MPKISVVVPMYNAEKFLNVCIASILRQTFKDFELILIDDCSTDKTLDIAKSFIDARIKILQTEKNLGYPGAVRNIGLDAAIGEYIYFMDHDDAILPEGFEVLVEAADRTCADAVTTSKWYVCNNFEDASDMDIGLIEIDPPAPVSEDLKIRLCDEIMWQGIHVAPWCSMYRRKFLVENKIRFPSEVAEDIFFTIDILFATSKIEKIDFPYYVWRRFVGSASHDINRIQRNMKSVLHLYDYLVKKLVPIDDYLFKSELIFYLLGSAMNSYLAPFFNVSDRMAMHALDEVTKAVEPRFGENTLFIRSLLHGYFQGRNAINEREASKKKFETKD